MIHSISLDNFRGIKKGELTLSPLTIILGANNSGKTTILEALFLAPNPFRQVPYLVPKTGGLAAGIVHSLHQTLDSSGYTFLFNNYISNKAEIKCYLNEFKYKLQFTKKDSHIYVTTNKQIKDRFMRDGEDIGKYFGLLGVSTNSFEGFYKDLLIENTFLMNSNLINAGYNYIRQNWASIINLGIGKKIAEDSSTFSYDKYKDITIEPFLGGKYSIYAYLEDGRRIRLGDLGEGVQNFITARLLYEVEKAKVLLWDDVGAHFNPRMILRISEWFSDLLDDGRQIVLTTHSIEATRMIASLNEDKAKIYLTSLKDGILEKKELTLKELEELYEAGIDVRTAEPFLL